MVASIPLISLWMHFLFVTDVPKYILVKWDLRFSQGWRFGLSCSVWHSVVLKVVTNVTERYFTSTFSVKFSQDGAIDWLYRGSVVNENGVKN
jgi:hypothetical protein